MELEKGIKSILRNLLTVSEINISLALYNMCQFIKRKLPESSI